jgi:hypothetical protein
MIPPVQVAPNERFTAYLPYMNLGYNQGAFLAAPKTKGVSGVPPYTKCGSKRSKLQKQIRRICDRPSNPLRVSTPMG